MIFFLFSDEKEGLQGINGNESDGINCNDSVISIRSSSYYFNIAILHSCKLYLSSPMVKNKFEYATLNESA